MIIWNTGWNRQKRMGRRSADIALSETGRQLQSQKTELKENQLSDQARREKSWLCVRFEKHCFSGRSRKGVPRNMTKNLLCGSWWSSTVETRWTLFTTQRESFNRESAFGSASGGQDEFLEWRKISLWSWNTEQLWKISSSQSTLSIPSPRGMISRDSCMPHETRNSWGTSGHVFEGLPAGGQLSSRIQRNWHHLPADGDKVIQDILWNMEKEWDESRIVSATPTPRFAKRLGTWNLFASYWRNFFSKWYSGNAEVFHLGTASRKIHRLSRPSVLVGQLQDRSVVDQRSGDCNLNRRSYDVAVDWRESSPWLWNAWCQDTILWGRLSLFRTSEEGRLLTWSMSIFGPPELVKLHKVHQICSKIAYMMMTFRISTQDGTELY